MVHRTHAPPEDFAAPKSVAPGSAAHRHKRRGEVGVVFVCRANRCRSPLAEHLTRQHAQQQGLALAVNSMGFLPSGFPTPPAGIRAADEHGLDLSAHRSRQLEHRELEEADVILALARAEARDLVAQEPQLWPKVFTLKQFLAHTAAQAAPAGADFATWVSAMGQARKRSILLGEHPDDDVADPMGKSIRVWRRTVRELDELTGRLLSSCAHLIPVTESTGR